MLDERIQSLNLAWLIPAKFLNGLIYVITELSVGARAPSQAYDGKPISKLSFAIQAVQSRKQFPAGQIARGSENEIDRFMSGNRFVFVVRHGPQLSDVRDWVICFWSNLMYCSVAQLKRQYHVYNRLLAS
jgi:hypothetical protein